MLRLGALPAANIPKKSCGTCKTNERRKIIRAPVDGQNEKKKVFYEGFSDLMTRVAKLILNSWEVNQQKDKIAFKYFSKSLLILQHEVVVNESLNFTCAVFG